MKICKKHGQLIKENTIEEKVTWGSGIYLRCNLCKIEKDRKWKKENRKKHIASSIRWKKNNRHRVNEWCRDDRIINPEKYKEWSKKGREKLGDLRSIKDVTRLRGITLDQYYSLVGSHENKCAICFKEETRKNIKGSIARLCIDHNHSTNNVRGLLCHGCNQVIGHAKESIDILKSAILYLEKYNIS